MSKPVVLKPNCFLVELNEVVIVDENHPCRCGTCEDCNTYWDVQGHQVQSIAVFDQYYDGAWMRCYYYVYADGSATLIERRSMKRG